MGYRLERTVDHLVQRLVEHYIRICGPIKVVCGTLTINNTASGGGAKVRVTIDTASYTRVEAPNDNGKT